MRQADYKCGYRKGQGIHTARPACFRHQAVMAENIFAVLGAGANFRICFRRQRTGTELVHMVYRRRLVAGFRLRQAQGKNHNRRHDRPLQPNAVLGRRNRKPRRDIVQMGRGQPILPKRNRLKNDRFFPYRSRVYLDLGYPA